MSKSRYVLVVEDVESEREIIFDALREVGLGLDVLTADTVQGAKELTASNDIEIVVLDRMLSDNIDGLSYLTWLDDLEISRPGILVTSSLSSVHDHVLGLDSGADDYINKPFEFAELCARLRAVARRVQVQRSPSTVFFFGSLEVRSTSKTALVNGEVLTLQPKSFQLLQALTMRQGEWISRKALWHEVWPDYRNLAPQDAPINNAISRLRGALTLVNDSPQILSQDYGYRLADPRSE